MQRDIFSICAKFNGYIAVQLVKIPGQLNHTQITYAVWLITTSIKRRVEKFVIFLFCLNTKKNKKIEVILLFLRTT